MTRLKTYIFLPIIVLTTISSGLFLFGCKAEDDYNYKAEVEVEQVNERSTIRAVESTIVNRTRVQVFMARGHEYISVYKTGLVHSESCPHSSHNRLMSNK